MRTKIGKFSKVNNNIILIIIFSVHRNALLNVRRCDGDWRCKQWDLNNFEENEKFIHIPLSSYYYYLIFVMLCRYIWMCGCAINSTETLRCAVRHIKHIYFSHIVQINLRSLRIERRCEFVVCVYIVSPIYMRNATFYIVGIYCSYSAGFGFIFIILF